MGGSAPETVVPPTVERPERAFAELRVAYGPELDYVDPALAFTTESWSLLWHVYLPLVTFRHAPGEAGAAVVPALAEDLPAISDDGLVYQFTLRAGLAYSDGRPVRAGDFEYAVERLRRMDSPGEGWFAGVEVEADDGARTVEFRLPRPQARFLQVLATPLAAPVPRGTEPVEQVPPATGPYAIERFAAGDEVVLGRNERFRPVPAVRPGNPDRIRGDLTGRARGADYAPARRPVPSVAYVFMNTQLPPFDRLELRRAVEFALDRAELAAAVGSDAVPTQNLLPPGVPGYARLDLYPHDLERARALVRQAGARGKRVTVWAAAGSRGPARALWRTLGEIGLRAMYQQLPAERYYAVVAGRRGKAQIGVATWSAPLPHPILWFDALLNGDRIEEVPNTNLSFADEPELNARIEELRRHPVLTEEIEESWAALDRLALEQALLAPFAARTPVHAFGARIDQDCVVQHVVFGLDLARLCAR
jgi:peptide/nickel transport system substrate-binding protein